MNDTRFPKLLFSVFSALAFAYFFHFYSQLPATVASHFDAHGNVNGWQSKTVFYGFLVGTILLMAFIGFALPRLMNRIPIQFVNLPNKNYWLAPERREASMEFLAAQFGWMACALLPVILFAFNYAIQCNLHPHGPSDSSAITYPLFALLFFMLLWTVRIFNRFGPPPEDSSAK